MRTALSLVLLVSTASAGQAQDESRRTDIEILVARTAIVRNVGLATAGAEAANRAADLGLERIFERSIRQRGLKPSLIRLGGLWFVSMPIASLAQDASHDFGHFARIDEVAPQAHHRIFLQWPWPVPLTRTVEPLDNPPDDPRVAAATLAGGEEGSRVLKDQVADRIYATGSADYFDWVLLAYAALDYPAYAFTDLRPSKFQTIDAFFNTLPGDFQQYAEAMAILEPRAPGQRIGTTLADIRQQADGLRHGAWLNLADFSLWSAVAEVARYVATGERRRENPLLRVAGLAMVPGAYSNLTPLGPEHGVDVRVIGGMYLSHVNVRRITTPANGRLWGAGYGIRSRAPGRRPVAEGQADVFQRETGSAGFRIEAGARMLLGRGQQPFESSIHAGYKSPGYVKDAPYHAGVLLSASTSVRF